MNLNFPNSCPFLRKGQDRTIKKELSRSFQGTITLFQSFKLLHQVTFDADSHRFCSVVNFVDIDIGTVFSVSSFDPDTCFSLHIDGIIRCTGEINFLEINIVNVNTILQAGKLLIAPKPKPLQFWQSWKLLQAVLFPVCNRHWLMVQPAHD